MKALSVRQPWAWAIIYALKNIENLETGKSARDYTDSLQSEIQKDITKI